MVARHLALHGGTAFGRLDDFRETLAEAGFGGEEKKKPVFEKKREKRKGIFAGRAPGPAPRTLATTDRGEIFGNLARFTQSTT